jgi:hypothetical protein
VQVFPATFDVLQTLVFAPSEMSVIFETKHGFVMVVSSPPVPAWTQSPFVSPLSVTLVPVRLVVAWIEPGAMNVEGIERVGVVPPLDVI